VEPVISFLQGKDPTLAHRLGRRTLVPEGPRFSMLHQQLEEHPESLLESFGSLGIQDLGKHIASLFLDDLTDVIQLGVDDKFSLSRYGERLALSQPVFDPLKKALDAPLSLVDQTLQDILVNHLNTIQPRLVGLSVPFPGNVYGAFRSAQFIRQHHRETRIVMGGGFINTELRELQDSRVFDYVDYITLDDGERPILNLIEHLEGKRPKQELVRTSSGKNNQVVFIHDPGQTDFHSDETGTPTTEGLPLDQYISLLEMPNPMHRLWVGI